MRPNNLVESPGSAGSGQVQFGGGGAKEEAGHWVNKIAVVKNKSLSLSIKYRLSRH